MVPVGEARQHEGVPAEHLTLGGGVSGDRRELWMEARGWGVEGGDREREG